MLAHWLPSIFPVRDPVLIFAIVLVLFLAAPIVMGRFRLPGMIGLLLAGAVLGPHALGVLARDAAFVLLGSVGLIYIMFTAALEIDLSVFGKYGAQGVGFGLLTFALPQGLGVVMAHYVLGFDWLPAVLLASMFASHTLLAYPIVSRLGLSGNRAVTAALGGTMITDTLALLVLAVVAGMAQGDVNEAFFWRLGVSISVYVTAILVGLPRLGRWFFRKAGKDGPAEFVFVLTSVFLCAALSHAAGLEPIIGAFLAGIALNRLIPHNGALMNRLTFTGEAIFIPFFLLSVGMLLDAKVMFGGFRTWAVALGMTVTVVGTKWLAAQGARVFFRYGKEEGQVIFGLSVVQAAATLACVMVGYRLELFDDAVVNGTIVMILVTCVLGPAVVGKFAPVLAQSEAQAKSEERPRRGILVPLLSEEQTGPAIELSLLVREKGSAIHPAFVAADGDQVEQAMAKAEKVLARAVNEASGADCVAEPIKRVAEHPGRALVRARKELADQTVVVPWDGAESRNGAHFGSVIDEIVSDRDANVLLCRLVHPLGSCRRMVIFLPPGAASSEGLAGASLVVERIRKQLGAPMLVIAHEPEGAGLEALFKRAEGAEVTVHTYGSFRNWLTVLVERLEPRDLLVLYALRMHEHGFLAETRGIAQRLAERFSSHDLLVVVGARTVATTTNDA